MSDLGYAAVVPDGWVAIGKREYAGLEADIDSELSAEFGARADDPGFAQARENIRTGRIEFLYPEDKQPGLHGNINVQVTKGRIPPTGTDVSAICDSVSQQFKEAFLHTVEVFRCELVRIGPHTTLVIESDGFHQGSRMIQYHLNHSPGNLLSITGSFMNENFASRKPAIGMYVRSIAFPQR